MQTNSVLLVLAALAGASPLAGQGEITHNNAVFRRTLTPFDETPTADLVGVSPVGTQDHLYETGWWFRVAGDSREFAFPVPTSQSYVGDTSTHIWTDVGGLGLFDAEEVTQVYDGGFPNDPDLGTIRAEMTITNRSDTEPLALELFHFADLDLQPGFTDDAALLAEWSPPVMLIEVLDPGASFAHYQAFGADAYLVRPFGANDVAAVLSDPDVDDFDNSGLPFAPGDLTAGYQFTLEVKPGNTAFVYVQLGVNWSVRCSSSNSGHFCDGFDIGDTSLWSYIDP